MCSFSVHFIEEYDINKTLETLQFAQFCFVRKEITFQNTQHTRMFCLSIHQHEIYLYNFYCAVMPVNCIGNVFELLMTYFLMSKLIASTARPLSYIQEVC